MPRVVHFEIHAAEPERAIRFYQGLFGWSFQKWGGPTDYWLIETGPSTEPGIGGGLLRRHGPSPGDGQAVNAYVCTVQVEGLDNLLERAITFGGSLALPKMAVPGVGWLAYVKDTEGNILGLMQNDPSAQ
jgi:uncharacterized protein